MQQKEEAPESLWHELNFIYAQRMQQNKKKRANEMAKEMILQSTSLSKEIAEIMKILQSNRTKKQL